MFNRRRAVVLIILGLSLGLVFFLTPKRIYIPFLVLVSGAFVGAYLIKLGNYKSRSALMKIFLAGLSIRTAFCVILAYISHIKNGHIFFLKADDYGYSYNAHRILDAWYTTGVFPPHDSMVWMKAAGDLDYAYWVAFLYHFVGPYHFLPLFINCVTGAFSIILLYKLAEKVFNPKVGLGAAGIFAFWPSLILWSTQNLRDALIIFFMLLIFVSQILFNENRHKFVAFLLFCCSFFVIIQFRFVLAFILALATIFTLLFSPRLRLRIAVCLLSLCLGISIIFNFFNLRNILQYNFDVKCFFSFWQALSHHHSLRVMDADSAFLVNVNINTFSDFLRESPRFIGYILFAPFPWQLNKISQLFAISEMLVWYFLVFFALKGAWFAFRYRLRLSLGVSIFVLATVIAFFAEGNLGTLFRHRAVIWPIFFIYISAGFFYTPEPFKKGPEIKDQ
ncbi:MAG: glycosyltransferase family 39 protein [Candidatus Omnitrophica bacterium]|nr:glycosyltransferase family 39 protein [Candidatus Omnitrophota bacterium]